MKNKKENNLTKLMELGVLSQYQHGSARSRDEAIKDVLTTVSKHEDRMKEELTELLDDCWFAH